MPGGVGGVAPRGSPYPDHWHPLFPRTWAVRTGAADVLGLVEPQYCDPEPVEIWRGPLNWFRAGCRGLVLLSREPVDVYRVLSQCGGGIVAEDKVHAKELTAALDHPWPHPPVIVGRSKAHHRVA
jgi:hypothetical protein